MNLDILTMTKNDILLVKDQIVKLNLVFNLLHDIYLKSKTIKICEDMIGISKKLIELINLTIKLVDCGKVHLNKSGNSYIDMVENKSNLGDWVNQLNDDILILKNSFN